MIVTWYILPDGSALRPNTVYAPKVRTVINGVVYWLYSKEGRYTGIRWWPSVSDLAKGGWKFKEDWCPLGIDIPEPMHPKPVGYINPFDITVEPDPIVIPPPPPILPAPVEYSGNTVAVELIDLSNSLTEQFPSMGDEAQMTYNVSINMTSVVSQGDAFNPVVLSTNPNTYLVTGVSVINVIPASGNYPTLWQNGMYVPIYKTPNPDDDVYIRPTDISGAYIDRTSPIYFDLNSTASYRYNIQGNTITPVLDKAGVIIPIRLVSEGATRRIVTYTTNDRVCIGKINLRVHYIDSNGTESYSDFESVIHGYVTPVPGAGAYSVYIAPSPMNSTYQNIIAKQMARQKLLFGISSTCAISSDLATIKSTFAMGNTAGVFSISLVEGIPSVVYATVISETTSSIPSEYTLGTLILRSTIGTVEGELYLGTTDPMLASPSFRVWKFNIPATFVTSQPVTFDFADPYGNSYLPSFAKLDITDMSGTDLITFAPTHDGKTIGLNFNVTESAKSLLLLTKLPDGSDVEISSTNLVTTVGQPKILNCVLRGLSKRIRITSLSLVRNTVPVTTPITSPALWASAIASDYAIAFDGNDIVTTSPTVTNVSSDITIIEKSYEETGLNITFNPTTVLGNPLLNVNRRLTITVKGDILDNLGAVITSNAVLGTLLIKGSVS